MTERTDHPTILLLGRYSRLGSSTRLRCLQYIPALEAAGFRVDVHSFYPDAHLHRYYRFGTKDRGLFLRAVVRRVLAIVARRRRADLVWIDDEALPWLPSQAEHVLLGSKPLVLDLDDAIHLRYDTHRSKVVQGVLGGKIAATIRRAAVVVTGNPQLAETARSAGARRVEVLPTVVDLDRYLVPAIRDEARLVIGWIGTPDTVRYLEDVAEPLRQVCRRAGAVVRVVGAPDFRLEGVPIEGEQWAEVTEAAAVGRFDVGIMPLQDGAWEKGKSGYKLIQMMAAGRPVVASPVGVNSEIVTPGYNGYLAQNAEEWRESLLRLTDDVDLRRRMGAAGRRRAASRYCLGITAPRLVSMMRSTLEGPDRGLK